MNTRNVTANRDGELCVRSNNHAGGTTFSWADLTNSGLTSYSDSTYGLIATTSDGSSSSLNPVAFANDILACVRSNDHAGGITFSWTDLTNSGLTSYSDSTYGLIAITSDGSSSSLNPVAFANDILACIRSNDHAGGITFSWTDLT
ncbi:MAG TPA: hypothetical protein PLW24_14965, partial [Burkholderiaceae bacterium]|nr:hypothetical protein [Burkholderiaceae bacterium]